MNPNFSSTPGVQIAMTRFSDVKYDADAQTAAVGAGLIWDDVYAALEPFNVSVVGGRVSGVGIAGFTLGGGKYTSVDARARIAHEFSLLGYSYKTNQFGLAIDNVVAFELALPNGTVTSVTATSNEELFFSLKVRSNVSVLLNIDLVLGRME